MWTSDEEDRYDTVATEVLCFAKAHGISVLEALGVLRYADERQDRTRTFAAIREEVEVGVGQLAQYLGRDLERIADAVQQVVEEVPHVRTA